MMQPFNLKGNYTYKIRLYNMFSTHTIQIENTNLITTVGKQFIINKLSNVTEDNIETICLGTGETSVKESDTDLEEQTQILPITITTNINNIILECTLQGDTLNGTSEIGVKTRNGALISHDVHEKIDVPTSASVTVKYYYTIQHSQYLTNFEETEYDNIYKKENITNVSSIIEEDTQAGYQKLDNISDLYFTNPAYTIQNDTLFLVTSDKLHPRWHKIILTEGSENID